MTPERRAELIAEARRRGIPIREGLGDTPTTGATARRPLTDVERARERLDAIGDAVGSGVYSVFRPMLTAPLGKNTIAAMNDPRPPALEEEVVVTAPRRPLVTRLARAADAAAGAGRAVAGASATANEYNPFSPAFNARGEAGETYGALGRALTYGPFVDAYHDEVRAANAADAGDVSGARDAYTDAAVNELFAAGNVAFGAGDLAVAAGALRGTGGARAAGALADTAISQPRFRGGVLAEENAGGIGGDIFAPARPQRYGENALQEPVPVRPQGPTDFARDMRFRSSDAADRGTIFPQAQQGALSDPFEPIGNAPGRREYAPQIFAGRKGAETLASTGEQRPLDAINLAEEMFARGASREEVYAATNQILEGTPYAGVSRTPDGQLRFEIDDSGAIYRGLPDFESERFDLQRSLQRRYGGTMADIRERYPDDPDVARYVALYDQNMDRITGNISQAPPDRLSDAFEHSGLGAAYPGVMDTPFGEGGVSSNSRGHFNTATGSLHLDGSMPTAERRSVVLHEAQHAVQRDEGFAKGGGLETFTQQAEAQIARDALAWRREIARKRKEMPAADRIAVENAIVQEYQQAGIMDWLPSREARDVAGDLGGNPDAALEEIVRAYGLDRSVTPMSPKDGYLRLAGETEARNVQTRRNLSADERRATPPWETQDVPDADQIIRFDGGTSASVSPFEPMGNARGDDFSRPGNAPQGTPFRPVEARPPSASELNRMVAAQRRVRPDAHPEDLSTIRWVLDNDGNYHVAHALDEDHYALLERLAKAGVDAPDQVRDTRELRGFFYRDEAGNWRSQTMEGGGPVPLSSLADNSPRPTNASRGPNETGGVGARADNDRGGVFSQMRGALTPEPRNLPRNPLANGVPPGRAANDRPLNPEIIEGTANPTPPRPPESLDVIQPQRTPYDNIDMPPAAGANPADRMAYIRNLVEKEFKGNEREAVAYLEYLRDVRSRSRMGDDFAEVTAADIEAIRSGAYKRPASTVETVRPRNMPPVPGDDGVFAPARPRQGEQNAGIGTETQGTQGARGGYGAAARAFGDYADGLSWAEIARRSGHKTADSAKQNVNLLLRRVRARIADGHSIEKVAAENGTDAATLRRALEANRPDFNRARVDTDLDVRILARVRDSSRSKKLRDIADDLGVSVGMVQRAINRAEGARLRKPDPASGFTPIGLGATAGAFAIGAGDAEAQDRVVAPGYVMDGAEIVPPSPLPEGAVFQGDRVVNAEVGGEAKAVRILSFKGPDGTIYERIGERTYPDGGLRIIGELGGGYVEEGPQETGGAQGADFKPERLILPGALYLAGRAGGPALVRSMRTASDFRYPARAAANAAATARDVNYFGRGAYPAMGALAGGVIQSGIEGDPMGMTGAIPFVGLSAVEPLARRAALAGMADDINRVSGRTARHDAINAAGRRGLDVRAMDAQGAFPEGVDIGPFQVEGALDAFSRSLAARPGPPPAFRRSAPAPAPSRGALEAEAERLRAERSLPRIEQSPGEEGETVFASVASERGGEDYLRRLPPAAQNRQLGRPDTIEAPPHSHGDELRDVFEGQGWTIEASPGSPEVFGVRVPQVFSPMANRVRLMNAEERARQAEALTMAPRQVEAVRPPRPALPRPTPGGTGGGFSQADMDAAIAKAIEEERAAMARRGRKKPFTSASPTTQSKRLGQNAAAAREKAQEVLGSDAPFKTWREASTALRQRYTTDPAFKRMLDNNYGWIVALIGGGAGAGALSQDDLFAPAAR